MALFDRRLLAYFDDAGIAAGGATLLERIKDYQRDLAEIEQELSKYQTLLGHHQVKFRHRDRHGWIERCNEQKTIKQRYRRAVEEMAREDDRDSEFRENAGVYEEEERHREHARRKSSKALSRQGTKDTVGRRSLDQPRLSNFEKVGGRPSIPGASGAMGKVWVQIDTVTGLPRDRSSGYIVRACWEGTPASAVETDVRPGSRSDDGDERCIIRQQLKLEVLPGARMVHISVHRRDDNLNSSDSLIGEVQLDIFDAYNLDVQVHPLTDKYGKHIQTAVNMRLTAPEALLNAAPKSSARGGSLRGSLSGQTQERKLSRVEETSMSITPMSGDLSTPVPDVGAGVPPRRKSSLKDTPGAVTQDSAAAPRERTTSEGQKGTREVIQNGAKVLTTPTPVSPGPNTDTSAVEEGGESAGEDQMEELDEDEPEESEVAESEEAEEEIEEEEEEETEEEGSGNDG
mmetsp:Transcript_92737/g.170150  ORF Transcript_92737/g.170150 Transcript_92737/m.170150 type:complete len:458 (+) Transcript_92737:37-1410(+)